MRTLVAIIASIFFLPLAHAWDSDLTIPAVAPVVDEFGLLEQKEVRDLSRVLQTIKEKSGVEVSVYIASTLQGREIEDFSIAVARKWGLGQKKTDRGLLLVVAPKERRMRFEVGSGLEGELTDAFTGQVLDHVLRPYFKQGEYYKGIVFGIAAIQKKIPLGIDSETLPPQKSKRLNFPLIILIIFVVIFVMGVQFLQTLGILPRNHYRGGGWGGGSGGFGGGFGGSSGGSWGGGGGGFSGGGSSSSW